ncbi:hypothetical protein BKA80DRAFT_272057 [Phyllosticta citrichinensis]
MIASSSRRAVSHLRQTVVLEAGQRTAKGDKHFARSSSRNCRPCVGVDRLLGPGRHHTALVVTVIGIFSCI